MLGSFISRFVLLAHAVRTKPCRCLSAILACGILLGSASSVPAVDYWWNQNGAAAGWGTGGTWDTTSAVFSTTDSDTASAAAATTTTTDTLYVGTSTVGFAGGTITANSTQSIGAIVTGAANTTAGVGIAGGTLTFAASGTVTNNSARDLILDSFIGSAGATTRLDLNAVGGAITMSGAFNAYTGITYVNSGTVFSNNAASLGASGTDANRTVVVSGARIVFNNSPRTYTERFEIAGAGVGGASGALVNTANRITTLNGQITLSGNATTYSDSTSNALTFGGGIVLGANALTFNSVNSGSVQTVQTTAISGTNGSVVKTGSGILNLNVASSYTGGTTLNAGTISVGNATALGSTSGQLTVNGGTLNLNNNSVTVGNLSGTGGIISGGSSGSRTLTIGQGDFGGGNFQGSITNGTGGTTALTKNGTGSITLSGNNTYSGTTTVSGGTLLVNNTSGSGTGSGNVAVNTGGTLGGSGIISGLVSINAGGFLAPGNSPGQLTVGGLTLNGTSTTTMELGGTTLGSLYDNVTITTADSLTYGGNLTVVDFGAYDMDAAPFTYDLFSFTGTTSGNFSNVFVNSVSLSNSGGNWTGTNGGVNYSFSQSTGDLVISVVPEPATIAILASGVAVGGYLQSRRRRG
jgi:autotransporter-associated beta strand protein